MNPNSGACSAIWGWVGASFFWSSNERAAWVGGCRRVVESTSGRIFTLFLNLLELTGGFFLQLHSLTMSDVSCSIIQRKAKNGQGLNSADYGGVAHSATHLGRHFNSRLDEGSGPAPSSERFLKSLFLGCHPFGIRVKFFSFA